MLTNPGHPPTIIPDLETLNQNVIDQINENQSNRYDDESQNNVSIEKDKILVTLDILDEDMKHKLCNKCGGYKPPRTHHCKICDRCVMRMDHHCLWTNNCIGINNHKYYTLYCVYLILYFASNILMHFVYLYSQKISLYNWQEHIFVIFTMILSIMGFMQANLIGLTNLLLLSRNQTLVELKSIKGKSAFDIGNKKQNLESVLGKMSWRWFFPIQPEQDINKQHISNGIDFYINPYVL